jgi:outer membrane protein assembly factor BamD
MRERPGSIVLWILTVPLLGGLLTGCGFRRQKYENPITKDTQQPDKVLYDKAVNDVEKQRYSIARMTLQTLISTYDSSEYLAKAKLLIAESWYREAGGNGLAQAEAEYKDFILFYPMMEEAAEAQEKVCMIHFQQMDKPDRDTDHAAKADEECRQVLIQFPNSKFAPLAQQRLREIQQVLAEHEYRVGTFYYGKGAMVASASRMQSLTDHYPLFSRTDDALWKLGDAYGRMGPRMADRSAEAYARIVREYPLSSYVDAAKKKLKLMERDVPEPDPVAMARMKYEMENQTKPGMMSHFWGVFRSRPDVSQAAKSGAPVMTALRPATPASVPLSNGEAGTSTDVTVSTVPGGGTSALDTQPDARQNPPTNAPQKQQSKKK